MTATKLILYLDIFVLLVCILTAENWPPSSPSNNNPPPNGSPTPKATPPPPPPTPPPSPTTSKTRRRYTSPTTGWTTQYTSPTTQPPASNKDDPNGQDDGTDPLVWVGIAVGVLLLAVVILLTVLIIRSRRNKRSQKYQAPIKDSNRHTSNSYAPPPAINTKPDETNEPTEYAEYTEPDDITANSSQQGSVFVRPDQQGYKQPTAPAPPSSGYETPILVNRPLERQASTATTYIQPIENTLDDKQYYYMKHYTRPGSVKSSVAPELPPR